MRDKLFAALAAVLVGAGPAAAVAQATQSGDGGKSGGESAATGGFYDHTGNYYLGLFGGYSRFGAIELTSTAFVNDRSQGRVKVDETKQFEDYDVGISGGFSVGYYLDQFIRVEGEYILRRASREQSDSDFVTVSPGSSNFQTSVTAQSLMVNGYRDFGVDLGLKPMIGVGVGLSRAGLKAQYDATGRAEYDDAANGVISWQVMNGASYELARILDVFVEVRYFATLPFEIKDQQNRVSRVSLSTVDILAGTTVRF